MLGHHRLMAFLATPDGERARRYYGEALGLAIVPDEAFALVCDANGTRLRVQKVDSFRARGFTVICWEVADVEATVDGLVARGVQFERHGGRDQDERGVWNAPDGARFAWFKDPDGNVLSVTES
jgi:catechol 2,3-dioxygenase-like lactoylglutathione lyase family enzyme